MGSPLLEAHFYTVSKVLNHPPTFLPFDSSHSSCYYCLEFGDGLRGCHCRLCPSGTLTDKSLGVSRPANEGTTQGHTDG